MLCAERERSAGVASADVSGVLEDHPLVFGERLLAFVLV